LNEEHNIKFGFGIEVSRLNKCWMLEREMERPTTARRLRERIKYISMLLLVVVVVVVVLIM
jgi:uncharacterized membrane protein YidH (DUF202 family)